MFFPSSYIEDKKKKNNSLIIYLITFVVRFQIFELINFHSDIQRQSEFNVTSVRFGQ